MNIGWLCKDVVLSQGSDAAVDIGKRILIEQVPAIFSLLIELWKLYD